MILNNRFTVKENRHFSAEKILFSLISSDYRILVQFFRFIKRTFRIFLLLKK